MDTRIQLDNYQKTVWTNGDLVSVFYRSDANQKWQYKGETGARIANLRVQELTIPATVTTICNDAFTGCELIYTFPEDEIDNPIEGPFGANGRLKTITIGSQVRTLHAYTFAFAKMTEMIIPGTVNEIKDYAFYNCTELGSMRFDAGTTPLTIWIPREISRIGFRAFHNCSKLSGMTLCHSPYDIG